MKTLEYADYGLNFNPFVLRDDHELVGEDRKKLIKKITGLVNNSVTNRRPIIAIIRGTYGEGKTFTLKNLAKEFDPPEKKHILAIQSELLDEKKSLPNSIMLHIYRKILRNDTVTDELLIELATKGLKNNSLDGDFKRILSAIISKNAESRNTGIRWLRAEKLSQRELQSLNMLFKIDSDEVAKKYLRQFLLLAGAADFKALVFLIDEFEGVLNQGKKKIANIADTLRSLFQMCQDSISDGKNIAPLLFFLAVSPEGWDAFRDQRNSSDATLAAQIEPFLRRMEDPNLYQLQPLNQNDTFQLIKVLLNKARKPSDALAPFTKETVILMRSHTGGTPSVIMKKFFQLLEYAKENGKKEIDEEFTNKFLEDSQAIHDSSDNISPDTYEEV